MCDARMGTDLPARLADTLRGRPRRTLTCVDKTRAAVLVPLLLVDTVPHLLFTRRAATLPHHAGQVAFPGGTHDPGDGDAVATALREAHEEVGLLPHDVSVLGSLDDIETVSSRFVITPIVGAVPHPYRWQPRPGEVDHVFTVSLPALTDPASRRTETWDFGGRSVPIDVIAVGGHAIWGATQRITRDLLTIVGDLD
jgi:8-oxo-dGTP pyrophosphatase MutT (NUDIX family)